MQWSRVNTKYSIHRVEAYTEYSIDWVQHTFNTGYTRYSESSQDQLSPAPSYPGSGPCCTQFCTFPQLWVNQWIESQFPSHMTPKLPPPDWPPPDSLPPDWLRPDWPSSDQSPPRTPPILINHGLQVYLPRCSIMASKCISELTWSRPPRASPNLLNHGLQMHLRVHSISVSNCIPKLAQSRPPCASLSSLDLSLLVQLQTPSITAFKSICRDQRRVLRDTGVSGVDRVTGSI